MGPVTVGQEHKQSSYSSHYK